MIQGLGWIGDFHISRRKHESTWKSPEVLQANVNSRRKWIEDWGNFPIIRINKVKKRLLVVEDLGSDHDTGEQQSMDIEWANERVRVPVHQPIYVYVPHHETRGAAVGVLEDPLQVLGDADARSADSVENVQTPSRVPHRVRPRLHPVVPTHQPLQHARHHCHHTCARRLPSFHKDLTIFACDQHLHVL